MAWIAIAATVDNIVISVSDDITLLREISDYDFDIIVKICGVSEKEYTDLKTGNLSWRVRFNNIRSTYLEPFEKTSHQKELSEIYKQRLLQIIGLRGRFEHALNKHKALLSQQFIIYESKVNEAKDILANQNSIYYNDGFVKDYSEESGLDIRTAASLIITKYNNWYEYLRKLERLRLRHFKLIKTAKTSYDFENASSLIDKDFFINMLL
jgi:hypothetical protein